ncbi:MAG: aminotransferase class I/II-fold pyridoxal phosphate-dependent enzyme [Oscillospiraceae bacterium]|jgi:arginine decarboxylase
MLTADEDTLFSRLQDYAASDAVPMHMPGHKRNPSGIPFLEALGARYDVTEIAGFDDLHAPHDVLLDAMERAARLWGSDRCFFLVNGSTCGVLAAIAAAAKNSGSGRIIMARNCHKSVYNAVELCGLAPIYLAPPPVEGFGFCGSIQPKDVEKAVIANPGTPVVLTSPTYEGVLTNVAEIAVVCHLWGSPLIVDEAHGAHLGFSPEFPGGAVAAGADVVIQSLHKTLSGLTQTGLLHLSGGLVPASDLQRELSIFETSSPSYLLMSSIDSTRALLETRGGELFRAWSKRLARFDAQCNPLQNLRLPGHSDPFDFQPVASGAGFRRSGLSCPSAWGFDRSKIVVSCENTDTTGAALLSALRERYHIECEMAAPAYVVAMTGLLDADENLERFAAALLELDREIHATAPRRPFVAPAIPPRSLSVREALSREAKTVTLREAVGKTAAEYVWAYPPGIPLAVPGELLTEELIKNLAIQRDAGISLRSSSGGMPKAVRVVE